MKIKKKTNKRDQRYNMHILYYINMREYEKCAEWWKHTDFTTEH